MKKNEYLDLDYKGGGTMRKDLKQFRINQFLTQQELADKLGISVSAYNLIENGKRRGSQDFWLSLQNKFNLEDGIVWKMQQLS